MAKAPLNPRLPGITWARSRSWPRRSA